MYLSDAIYGKQFSDSDILSFLATNTVAHKYRYYLRCYESVLYIYKLKWVEFRSCMLSILQCNAIFSQLSTKNNAAVNSSSISVSHEGQNPPFLGHCLPS